MEKPPDIVRGNKMNIVGIALEAMLFLPLSIGMAGALFCAWRDRRHAHTKTR